MEQVLCETCGEPIHPKRIEILPYTKVCVKCSTEVPKAGRIYTKGRGEDFETELEILDRNNYRKLKHYDKFSIPEDSDELFEEEDNYKDSYISFQNSSRHKEESEDDGTS